MEASTASELQPRIEEDVFHKVKMIQFLGRITPIILQEANGPCALVAICNVLSLNNRLNLSRDIVEVSQKQLISLVAEHLTDANVDIEGIGSALDLLHKLPTGIELDIKFRRINDFVFPRECTIFDSLNIPLYHGWMVDPQDYETAEAIGSKSYNTLMEELVALDAQNIDNGEKTNSKTSDADFADVLKKGSPHRARKGDIEEEAELLRVLKLSKEMYNSSRHIIESTMEGSRKYDNVYGYCSSDDMDYSSEDSIEPAVNEILKPVCVGRDFRPAADNLQGGLIKNFLRNSASQLTVYGLSRLKETVKEHELCVFFRNNHFNTMFKYEGELFILVADQGYLNQPDLVWEKLSEVNGDNKYMNDSFEEFKMDDHSKSTENESNDMASTQGSTDNAAREGQILDIALEVALGAQWDEYEDEQGEWFF